MMGVDIKAMFPNESRLHLAGFTAGPATVDGKGQFAGMVAQHWGVIDGHIQKNRKLMPGAWDPRVGYAEVPHTILPPEVGKVADHSGNKVPALRFSTYVFDTSSDSLPFGLPSSLHNLHSSLLVVGKCFQRIAAGQPRNVIFIACDNHGQDPNPKWMAVPVTDDKLARNDLGGDIVTGTAGFTTSSGKDFFFVEFYSWPSDPVIVGG
jgi:hypothetical protein